MKTSKKLPAFVIAFTMVASFMIMPVSVSAVEVINLVSNPGFEDGNLDGWVNDSQVTISTEEAHSGTYSAKFVPTSTVVGTPIAQAAGFEPDKYYHISAWIKPETAQKQVNYDKLAEAYPDGVPASNALYSVKNKWYNETLAKLTDEQIAALPTTNMSAIIRTNTTYGAHTLKSANVATNTDWVKVESVYNTTGMDAETTAGANIYVQLCSANHYNAYTCYFDDFAATEIVLAETENLPTAGVIKIVGPDTLALTKSNTTLASGTVSSVAYNTAEGVWDVVYTGAAVGAANALTTKAYGTGAMTFDFTTENAATVASGGPMLYSKTGTSTTNFVQDSTVTVSNGIYTLNVAASTDTTNGTQVVRWNSIPQKPNSVYYVEAYMKDGDVTNSNTMTVTAHHNGHSCMAATLISEAGSKNVVLNDQWKKVSWVISFGEGTWATDTSYCSEKTHRQYQASENKNNSLGVVGTDIWEKVEGGKTYLYKDEACTIPLLKQQINGTTNKEGEIVTSSYKGNIHAGFRFVSKGADTLLVKDFVVKEVPAFTIQASMNDAKDVPIDGAKITYTYSAAPVTAPTAANIKIAGGAGSVVSLTPVSDTVYEAVLTGLDKDVTYTATLSGAADKYGQTASGVATFTTVPADFSLSANILPELGVDGSFATWKNVNATINAAATQSADASYDGDGYSMKIVAEDKAPDFSARWTGLLISDAGVDVYDYSQLYAVSFYAKTAEGTNSVRAHWSQSMVSTNAWRPIGIYPGKSINADGWTKVVAYFKVSEMPDSSKIDDMGFHFGVTVTGGAGTVYVDKLEIRKMRPLGIDKTISASIEKTADGIEIILGGNTEEVSKTVYLMAAKYEGNKMKDIKFKKAVANTLTTESGPANMEIDGIDDSYTIFIWDGNNNPLNLSGSFATIGQ